MHVRFVSTVLLLTLSSSPAQKSPKPPSRDELAERAGYHLSDAGPNHSTYRKLVTTADAATGEVSTRTNSFTILSAGKNMWNGSAWVESDAKLVVTNNSILGIGTETEVRFSANINTDGATKIRVPPKDPHGRAEWINTHLLGIALETPETNIVIGTLRDSEATVTAKDPRAVLYTNALEGPGLLCSVRYDFSQAGVAQNVIIHSLPSLQSLGLANVSPDDVKVVVMSELVNSPTPRIRQHTWTAGGKIFSDQFLDFGTTAMIPGKSYRVGADRKTGIPTEKRFEIIAGRSVLLELLPLSRVQKELQRTHGAETALNATSGANGSEFNKKAALAKAEVNSETVESRRPRSRPQLNLPPRPKVASAGNATVRRVASLQMNKGYIADFDYVSYGSNWDTGTNCRTWVIQGELHVHTNTWHPGTILKQDPGSSLWVDGPFYWNTNSTCPSSPAIITSTSDEIHGGESLPWSCGSPGQGEYGPAMAVADADLTNALAHVTAYYAQPGVIDNPVSVPTVTASTLDPIATKGTADYGVFAITRSGWDDSHALQVSYSVSGSAVPGADYVPLGTSVTIRAGEDTVAITNVPLSVSGTSYRTAVILSLQASNTYAVGTPSTAQGSIFDPTAPDPAPAAVPSGLVTWWRAETNILDSVGTNHGLSLVGGAGFTSGKVGTAFTFTNENSGIDIGVPPQLQIQNFSIETWARRADTNWVSYGDGEDALFLTCGWSGWGFGIAANGRPLLSLIGSDILEPNVTVTDTNWHHFAITKTNSTVVFYLDGVAYPASCYGSTFATGIGMFIGAVADPPYPNSFQGDIDDPSFYNRVLSAEEIQSICNADWQGKFHDTGSIGINDTWRLRYFGTLTVDPNADPDGDGVTNLQEYQQRLNPLSQSTRGDGTIDQPFKVIINRPAGNSSLP
jgi:hypothetical protein